MYCLLAAYEDQLTLLQSELEHVHGELKAWKKIASAKTLEIEETRETLAKEKMKETLDKETLKKAFEKLHAQYVGMLPFSFLTCSVTCGANSLQ